MDVDTGRNLEADTIALPFSGQTSEQIRQRWLADLLNDICLTVEEDRNGRHRNKSGKVGKANFQRVTLKYQQGMSNYRLSRRAMQMG